MANLSYSHRFYRILESILTRYLLTDRRYRSAHRQRFSILTYLTFSLLTIFSAFTFGMTAASLVFFLGCCTYLVI